LVTGLSGAGQNTALNALEDLGFETYNLPIHLIGSMLDHGMTAQMPCAIRVHHSVVDLTPAAQTQFIDQLFARDDVDLDIVFLDCDTKALQQRFPAPRRRHRLHNQSLENIFDHDRAQLKPLQERATMLLDTSDMNPKHLAKLMRVHFGLE